MNRSPSPLAETSPLPTALAIALAFAALTFGLTADGADWPTYMRDNARSGVTAEKLRPPLAARWVFTPSHPPRPAWPDPVKEPIRVAYDLAYHVAVADGSVYFGSSAEDKVYCLDAATGAVRWAAFTGGPVRLAPTVWQGNVYVGSDDGHVYCLSGTDGRVLWKFRGAPNDRQAMGNGRMMSVWPVRTGVLVANGVAHFAAGLFPTEGVFVYALDARTGKELWRNDTSGQIYRKMPHPGAEGFSGVSPQGALLASSSVLYVPTGRNVPAAFELQTGQLIQYRPDRTRVGGTYALVWDDKVFSGPAGLAAYDSRSGDIFAAFPSRQLLLTADMAYLLTDTQITAVQRQNYTDLRAKHTALGERRSAVASDHKRWTRTLQGLQAKQKEPTPETEEAQKKVRALDAQMKELAAEMDKLNQPMAACLKWQCNAAGLCSMVLAGDVLLA
ncbi:MAG: hypothetical protein FJ279_19575, partial [Planctomycetes bacterium]|nr:hypothetical protein [Planctomycetota bacterium]